MKSPLRESEIFSSGGCFDVRSVLLARFDAQRPIRPFFQVQLHRANASARTIIPCSPSHLPSIFRISGEIGGNIASYKTVLDRWPAATSLLPNFISRRKYMRRRMTRRSRPSRSRSSKFAFVLSSRAVINPKSLRIQIFSCRGT